MSRLIETVAFRVPSGFNAAAEAAAKASGVVVSEFMRQAIQDRIEADLIAPAKSRKVA